MLLFFPFQFIFTLGLSPVVTKKERKILTRLCWYAIRGVLKVNVAVCVANWRLRGGAKMRMLLTCIGLCNSLL